MVSLQQTQNAPVVSMCLIEGELWAAAGNLIYVYDEKMELVRTISPDAQVPVAHMMVASFSDFLLVFVGVHGKLVVLDAVSKALLHSLSLPEGHVVSLVQMTHNVVLSGDNLGAVLRWPLA